MQVWNVLHGAHCKYRTQKVVKKSPSGHHRAALLGYIFATKAHIDNRKKNLLSSNIFSTCSHNMVNFSPLATSDWDRSASLGHPCKFQRVSHLGSVTAWHSSIGRQPNFVALKRRRHPYSAGRPSHWALAHILVVFVVSGLVGSRPSDHYFRSVCLSVCLFVCAEFFLAVFDPISIKLGHMLYVWV